MRCPVAARLSLLCLLALPICLLSLPPSPVSAQSSLFTIPYTTWGPAPINLTASQLVNSSVYGGRLPPVNASLPVLRLAGALTQTGAYTTNTALLNAVLPFMLDVINVKGGVVVEGQPHLLSLTWVDDGSSAQYLQLLYAQLLDDPSIALLLSPPTNAQYQLVLPLMRATNRTWLNLADTDPLNFAAHYPHVWTPTQPKDLVPKPTMTQIDQRAQLYAQQLAAGQAQPPPLGYVSPWGITSVCMYTHNDSTPIETCAGIREWLNDTNAQRTAQGAQPRDLLTLVADVFWGLGAAAVDQRLYTDGFGQCPDGVDLLVVCGEASTADAAAVAAALQSSQLRPKAAYSSSTLPSFDPTNATMLTQWSGWLTHASPAVTVATLPDPTFLTSAEFIAAWKAYYATDVSPSSYQLLWPSIFEMLRAALLLTPSLSSDDLTAAFLLLNGTTYVRGVRFDPLTGCNSGSVAVAAQIQGSAGLQLVSPAHPLVYPVPWAWTRVRVGDRLRSSQTMTAVLVSSVMAVLGCWVGMILVEQAVFVRRKGGRYAAWLLLVAVSIGLAGVWCSQFNQASALSVTLPSTGTALPLQWSLWVAVLAWLPAVLCCWSGLLVLIQDVEPRAGQTGGEPSKPATAAHNRQQQEEERRMAALSFALHVVHLRQRLTWRVVLGGALVSVAMWLSRYALWSGWAMQAVYQPALGPWVVSAVLAVVLVVPALLMYFHALRWRVAAVFLLALAVVVDWQVHLGLGQFTYAASVLSTPSPLYSVLLQPLAVSLITGVVCAVTSLSLVGLQFSRMQLSRNSLSVLVVSLEAVVQRQLEQHSALLTDLAKQRAHGDGLARLLECINIARPMTADYALALAAAANSSTLTALFDVALAQSSSTAPRHRQSMTASSVDGLTPREDACPCPMPRRISAIDIVSIAGRAAADAGVEGEEEIRGRPAGRSLLSSPLTAHVSSVSGRQATIAPMRRSSECSPPGEQGTGASENGVHGSSPSPEIAPPRPSPPMPSSHRRVVSLSAHFSLPEHDAHPHASALYPPTLALGSVQDRSREMSISCTSTHQGAMSSSPSHDSPYQRYEADVSRLLAELSLHPITAPHQSPHSSAGAELRALPLGGARAGSISASRSAPSLAQLLQHPACVELIKEELERLHCVESLMFALHAVRYRRLLHSAKMRRRLAAHLYDTFIAEGSPEQVNLSTRQRSVIATAVHQNKDDACPVDLFQEAEREVALLIDTNLMKTFAGTAKHRLCVWMYHAVDVGAVLGEEAGPEKKAERERRVSLRVLAQGLRTARRMSTKSVG